MRALAALLDAKQMKLSSLHAPTSKDSSATRESGQPLSVCEVEKVRRLIENLGPIQNTIQYSWLVEMCQAFFGLKESHVSPSNWEKVYDEAERQITQQGAEAATDAHDGVEGQERQQAQYPEARPREPITWGEQPQSHE